VTEEEIFTAALELPERESRASFLEKACGGDVDLQRRVEALLNSHFRSGEFLDVPAVEQLHVGQHRTDQNPAQTLDSVSERNDESASLSFLTPSTRHDSLGCLGRYEVLQVIGQGGFGIVLRGYDDQLQRVVAIKVLAPHLAVTSPARKRFLREARASAAARHENVVQVYEVGEQPLPYLVMEYIPGETLQQYLDRSGPLDVAQSLRIARQIAEGLAAAHASDLIHRDIKPSNILLEAGQRLVKITDFGLARAADDASLTQSGMIAGTPLYMAPEQALGKTLDHRADLFSLGSVLYQLLTGRPPFRANSTLAVMKRVAEDTPRPIREIIPETPQWLCDVVGKLQAKDPANRFQSAREVAEVLGAGEARLLIPSQQQDELVAAPQSMARTGFARRIWLAVPLGLALVAAALYGPGLFRKPADQIAALPSSATLLSSFNEEQIETMPAAEQVAAVFAELRKRNPNFSGSLDPTFDGDHVVGIACDRGDLRDITPLRALGHLQILSINNAPLNDIAPLQGLQLTQLNLNECELTDLSPLRGMPLESLGIRGWSGTDLSALEGMPLKMLNCSGRGQKVDLSPLSGLPLEQLFCNTLEIASLEPLQNLPLQLLQCAESNVADLTPLRGLQLSHLNINHTQVSDLSPLIGMPLSSFDCQGLELAELKSLVELPLVEIYCDFDFDRHAPLLRTFKSLKRINDEPAAKLLKKRKTNAR
jgi:eukaryotic-like serine/threonine-protein kinase